MGGGLGRRRPWAPWGRVAGSCSGGGGRVGSGRGGAVVGSRGGAVVRGGRVSVGGGSLSGGRSMEPRGLEGVQHPGYGVVRTGLGGGGGGGGRIMEETEIKHATTHACVCRHEFVTRHTCVPA